MTSGRVSLNALPEVFVRGSGSLRLSSVGAGSGCSVAGRATLGSDLRFHATSYVAARVFPEMIFAVESFTALLADVLLLARVNDDMQRQLLLPFEGFHADLRIERLSRWFP